MPLGTPRFGCVQSHTCHSCFIALLQLVQNRAFFSFKDVFRGSFRLQNTLCVWNLFKDNQFPFQQPNQNCKKFHVRFALWTQMSFQIPISVIGPLYRDL